MKYKILWRKAKWRIVEDDLDGVVLEVFGPWPKHGAPRWRTLCDAEVVEQAPKYAQAKLAKYRSRVAT